MGCGSSTPTVEDVGKPKVESKEVKKAAEAAAKPAAQTEPVAAAQTEPAAAAQVEPAAEIVTDRAAEPEIMPEAAAEPVAEIVPEIMPETAAEPVAETELVVPDVPGDLSADSTIIFVLGGPGSGKGTQCDKIKETYEGVVHLSAGDLLRAEVASGSEAGKKCEVLMKEGKLVPQSVTITLLKNAMIQSGGKLFLVDGFPRALDQAETFESSIMPCKAVLFFDCPEDEMEKRLLKRGETSGRSDDNAETIRKRFKTFIEQSLPVKDRYKPLGKLFEISAVQAPDEVFLEVKKALDSVIVVA